MAEIIIVRNVPSITVDKEFLIKLFKVINSKNPRKISVDTKISIDGATETKVFDNLRDLDTATVLPRDIESITLTKEAKKDRDVKKVVSLHFTIDIEHPNESYYELTGYDEAKIELCKKEIDSLVNEYRTWYWFLLKGTKDDEDGGSFDLLNLILIAITFSFSLGVYRYLELIRGVGYSDSNQGYGILGFFVFLFVASKIRLRFFPYLDLRLRKEKRAAIWNWILGTIILALLGNLIWEGVKLLL